MTKVKTAVFSPYKFKDDETRTAFKMYCLSLGRSMQDVMQTAIEKEHPEPFKPKKEPLY
jgi:hypothetical protein